jgi:oligo-1,6-glucosidase
VVCNVSRTPCELADLLPEAVGAELVLGNLPDAGPTLRPWEARILRTS